MKNRTILTMAMLIAAMMLATGVVAFSDASDADTVTGTDHDTVPTTVFVVGTEYDNVFIGYGKDPQAALDGMTSCSKEVDGVDKMFMSGTPTSWQGILIPFDAGSTAYLAVETVPMDDGYGATPTFNGTNIYLTVGQSYDFIVCIVSGGADVDHMVAPVGMEYDTGDGQEDYRELILRGTPSQVGTYTVEDESGSTYTIHVIDSEGDVPPLSLTISPATAQVVKNGTIILTTTVLPSNASQDVIWESLDPSIATVDSNGVVTGKKVGATTIKAKSFIDSSVYDTREVTVTEGSTPVQSSYRYSFWVWTGNSYEMLSQDQTTGNVELTTPDNPTGYTFKGWTTYASAQAFDTIQTSGTAYTGSTTIDTDTWFYAIYTKNAEPVQQFNYSFWVWAGNGYTKQSDGQTSGNVNLPTPNTPAGYTFKGWAKYTSAQSFATIQTSGTTFTGSTTISSDSWFYAVYTKNADPAQQYTISVVASPSDGGTVSGGGTYDSGWTVTLTANANKGYIFSGWSDNVSSATRTVTVSENRTYTAVFTYQSNPVESKRTVNFAISDASLGNINITVSASSLATTIGNTLSVPSGTTVSNNNGTLVFTYNGTEAAKAWVTATNGNFSGWSMPTSVIQSDGTTFTATMAAEQFDWEEFLHQNATMLIGAVLIIIIGLLIITRL